MSSSNSEGEKWVTVDYSAVAESELAKKASAVAQELGLQMMYYRTLVRPMHDWLEGEVAYFLRQGYTERESRAMAACEFVVVFGVNLRDIDQAQDDDSDNT